MSLYVPAVRPLSWEEIRQKALEITKAFYPSLLKTPAPFPVLDLFDHVLKEFYCLDTGVEKLADGVEGITWPDGRVIVSEETYRGAYEGKGRCRFTVAHEIFHGIAHKDQINNSLMHFGQLTLYRRNNIQPFRDPECQANTFASALLMPEEMVRVVAAGTSRLFLPQQLSQVFMVSHQAAKIRIGQVKDLPQ